MPLKGYCILMCALWTTLKIKYNWGRQNWFGRNKDFSCHFPIVVVLLEQSPTAYFRAFTLFMSPVMQTMWFICRHKPRHCLRQRGGLWTTPVRFMQRCYNLLDIEISAFGIPGLHKLPLCADYFIFQYHLYQGWQSVSGSRSKIYYVEITHKCQYWEYYRNYNIIYNIVLEKLQEYRIYWLTTLNH